MKSLFIQNARRLFTALLVLLLSVVGMSDALAQINHDFTAVAPNGQTLYYKITSTTDYTVMVTHPYNLTYSDDPYYGYTKPTGELIIPYYVEYNGVSYSVTAIDDRAFGTIMNVTNNPNSYACRDLTSVVIPSSVITIGQQAFARCASITTVTIPTSVTSIGSQAFRYCSSLVTVNFNASNCETIGSSTWSDCAKFTTLNLGNTVTCIPKQGFQGASKITSVTIPKNVTKIGMYGFDGCTSLASVTVNNPSQMDSIYSYAFRNCSSLGTINLPESLVYIGNDAFRNCSALQSTPTSQLLPSALVSIGDYAFQSASSLAYLRVPSTVTSIGKYAFRACTSLTTVDYEASNCTYSGTQAEPPFYECAALNTISVRGNVTQVPDYCFKDATALASLTLNEGLASIGTYGFYGCQYLQSLILPASVNSIGSFAFGNSYDIQMPRVESHSLMPPVIGGEVAFPSGQTIHVPGAVVSLYQSADYWKDYDLVGYYGIGTTVNPTDAGTVAIDGETMETIRLFDDGETCMLTAVPNEGYHFTNWTENDEVVATDAAYSFTVNSGRSLVANFTMNDYAVMAMANPTVGGTITGTGQYTFGSTATLTAIPNEGYTFQYWSEDAELVSTDATYSFVVTGSRMLEAHFDGFTIHWTPEDSDFEDNMTLTCIVQLDGEEQASNMLELGAFCGNQCRGSQRATYFAPTQHYIYQMTVFGEVGDAITFHLYDHEEDQELLLTSPSALAFSSNGYGSLSSPYLLNFTSTVLISAEVTPAQAGTITGTGRYSWGTEVTLTAAANEGFRFVNWTQDGEEVSTDESYSFVAEDNSHFVAHFQRLQSQELSSGWTWWSSYIELSNTNGLEQLENSLGSAGVIIKSRTNGYVEAYPNNGVTEWYGNLANINNEQMYKIRTKAVCNAMVAGEAANPASHSITIKSGWNWIGFPSNESMSVETAMAGFTPEVNDIIKGRNSYTTYYSDNGYQMWYGTLNTLEPGKGYMYRSYSSTQKTLTFQSGRSEALLENVTDENNVFRADGADFADNMTITAVVELEGVELRSDTYELAAFVGETCRGSVKLMYVEPIDRYVAFLTVLGDAPEVLQFRLTDGTETSVSLEGMAFVSDGMVGSLTDPVALRFGTLGMADQESSQVSVFPNPSEGVFRIAAEGLQWVEVFNALGQLVLTGEVSGSDLELDLNAHANGLYLLRLVTANQVYRQQIVKK